MEECTGPSAFALSRLQSDQEPLRCPQPPNSPCVPTRSRRATPALPTGACFGATGVGEGDWNKPFIAVCNSHVDIIPGHVHLQEVGNFVKECIRAAGGVPFLFNTIGVDDGIAMGHNGMKYSLPSREIIADSVETMCERTGSTR